MRSASMLVALSPLKRGEPAPMFPSTNGLRAWIREHEVCFEITPHFELHNHQRLQVGFDLTLMAVVPTHPDAGAPETRDVYERLLEIAQLVLPASARREVEPFDAAYHLRREHAFEPEVQLVTQVLHPHGTFDEVDEKDRPSLEKVGDALRTLGAQERVWRQLRGGQ